jgi:hypothetical protein
VEFVIGGRGGSFLLFLSRSISNVFGPTFQGGMGPGAIRAYSFLKYSTIAVWYVYCNHTGENCAVSAFLWASGRTIRRLRDLTRCGAVPEAHARGRNCPPLPLVASTDLAEYYDRRKPLDLLQVSAKRARASVDVDASQAASPCECVDAFPRAGVAGDPTPVGRSRA